MGLRPRALRARVVLRYKATKIHTLTPLTYELFFQNSSKTKQRPNVQIQIVQTVFLTIL